MKYFLYFFLFISFHTSFATHNKGGRIEVDFIGVNNTDLRFKITISTYTKTSSIQADRPTLDSVYFGDGSPAAVFVRSQKIDLPNDMSINTYINYHTYSTYGIYNIHFTDPNLNADIINITGSIGIPFHLETIIVLDPLLCNYYSPHLLSIPVFKVTLGKDFSLSRSSYDPNWDSLSYELITNFIPGYWIPGGVNLDPVTGEFTWKGDSMSTEGEYAFIIKTSKWSHGIFAGSMIEHLQLILYSTPNIHYGFNTSSFPPDFTSHVLPGDTFSLHIEYTDPDSSYTFSRFNDFTHPTITESSIPNFYSADVSWITSMSDVRSTPFFLIFRGREDLTYKVYVDGTPTDTCRALIGINEIENINFNFFPNPVADEIHFNLYESNSNQIKINLFDVLGKSYLEKIISPEEILNVSNLKTGMYLIKIDSGEKQFVRKFIKL
jgi:hypothetical protein